MSLQYDLIALDIDGTLLTDDHVLTKAIHETVNEAADRGAQIVLCTGRGPLQALPVLEELGLGGRSLLIMGQLRLIQMTVRLFINSI